MNIESLNYSNKRVSIPLKANKKNNPSFTGHSLTKDSYGNDVYKFYLPNAQDGTKVILTKLIPDGKGNYVPSYTINKKNEKIYNTIEKKLTGNIPSATVDVDDLNLKNDAIIGYKFILPNGTTHLDNTAKALISKNDNTQDFYTMATPTWTANSEKPRVMMHIMPDSFNVKNYNGAKRNHFNVLGGTINSIIEKLDYVSESGFNTILGLPIFGNDNNSSHGYWTNNPYQITKNLGTITDFKNLMIELYKRDMRWTADGAFVNEGIPGVHIADFVSWGADSPLIDMYETKDIENIPSRFGVFSKNQAVNRHAHIKLVNAPYKIIFEKSNDTTYKEKAVKHASYDPNKPTYIQVFDDRLASEEQMNSNEIFTVYDKKETDDNFEIANYRDSVQAYNRKVPVSEVLDNYQKYKSAKKSDKKIQFKNYLMKWKNFEFVETNKDGGVSLWVGNSDISKKQFVIPEKALQEDLSREKRLQKRAAQYQVQDDTVQVVSFWTKDVANTLIEYTANILEKKINDIGKNDYKTAIKSLIADKKLPAGAISILSGTLGESQLDNILKKDFWSEESEYKLSETKQPKSIEEGMMAYPFDAIEFSPDLTTVLTYPFIKNLAVSEDTVGLTRYEMYQMGDDYYSQIPSRYRDLYKKTDSLLAGPYTNMATKILSSLEESTGKKLLDSDNKLTPVGKEIYSLIAGDIAKFITITALAPTVGPNYENTTNLEYDVKDLNKISLNTLNLQYAISPEDIAEKLINKIEEGIESIPYEDIQEFVEHLSGRINLLNEDSIKIAKLIIEKTESGLDWRIDAAKDVGSYDAVYDGKYGFTKNENMIMGFWNKINKASRTYNPRAFSIGELTDWGNFPKSIFASKTNFSTITDYESFYSLLLSLYGQDSEGKNISNAEFAQNVYKNLDNFLNTGYLSNVNYAHRFVDNHDKPRALHLLGLDVKNFLLDKAGTMKTAISQAIETTPEFKSLDENLQNMLYQSIFKLSTGKVVTDELARKFDSEKFGTRSFDFNIDAVINNAIESYVDFKEFAQNKKNEELLKKLKANTEHNMLRGAFEKMRAIWFAMTALPGSPTMYGGTELGMTGWETDSKNEQQECRNALKWNRLEDENYKFIKEFKERLDAITKIRTKDGASALVNGTTIPLNSPGNNVAAFYRYNDKTDAICILHANGFTSHPQSQGTSVGVNYIPVNNLPFELKTNTVYVDALNPDSKFKVCKQKVENNEISVIKKLGNNNQITENIDLGNAGLILLREEDFNGKKFTFNNKNEDIRVKLANTKYNMPTNKN